MIFGNISTIISLTVYIIAIGLITYFSAKKENYSDFINASKNLGWKQLGFSTFATSISSYNVIIGITLTYLLGIYFIFVILGLLLAFTALYHIGKMLRKSGVDRDFINLVDFFNWKYGRRVATLINLITLFVLLFFITLQINVNGTIFSGLLSISIIGATLITTGVVFIYSYIGGFKTDVMTDIFQGVFMFAIVALVFMVDTSSITQQNIISNLSDKTILISAIAFMFLQFLVFIVAPEIWQRVYAAKDDKELKKGFVFASALLLLFFIAEMIIGMSARYSGLVTNVGNAFYEVLYAVSPIWFFPIIAVSLIAAFMSTLDSSLFAISSQLGKSGFIVGYKDEEREGMKMQRKIKIWMVVVTAITLILSLFLSNFLTAVFNLVSILSVLGAVYFISLIIRVPEKEMLISIIVGAIAFVYASLSGIITQDPLTSLYPSIFLIGYMIVQRLFVKLICERDI